GDPEVVNADGYKPRWSPQWDEGSDMPIYKYWKGKYSSGTPNADLNAFLNFYSQEERHMFTVDSTVSRTYRIYMPTDNIVAGYAIEACWEPPSVMPVTNPLEDFPITANQTEAYRFHFVVNNGEVITDCESCCGQFQNSCDYLHIELGYYPELWEDIPFGYPARVYIHFPPPGDIGQSGDHGVIPCDNGWFYLTGGMDSCCYGNGTFRIVAFNHGSKADGSDIVPTFIAYDVFDYTVDDPNH
ncbi:MAG: hypothetical protein NTY09_00460, partial [bacterium]|nr:hypothetical protein [bacterium]